MCKGTLKSSKMFLLPPPPSHLTPTCTHNYIHPHFVQLSRTRLSCLSCAWSCLCLNIMGLGNFMQKQKANENPAIPLKIKKCVSLNFLLYSTAQSQKWSRSNAVNARFRKSRRLLQLTILALLTVEESSKDSNATIVNVTSVRLRIGRNFIF